MIRGGIFFFIPIVLIFVLATAEYVRLTARLGWRLPLWLLMPSVILQLAAGQWSGLGLAAPAMVVSLLAVLVYGLWAYEYRRSDSATVDVLASIGGILLLGWVGSHFLLLRGVPSDGLKWTLVAMLTTWLADAAAYFVGYWWGRHKLAPRLSPNKTVEGYVAGIVTAIAFTTITAQIIEVGLPLAMVIGALISVVGPAGDLGVSLLKREATVKDSGRFLPGQGGALDRIDNLMWSVTLTYYVVSYFT
jgi:phosphatidate cytidylyltransferase